MKKKIIALCLVVVLAATAIVGGTLAYFTDTDSATNVMTMGNINIEQSEWQRTFDENGKMTGFEEFEPNKLMMPGVYDDGNAKTKVEFNDADSLFIANGTAWCDMWDESAGQYNAIDKIVVVENTGKNDVYYRTLIAIEAPNGEGQGDWDQNPKDSKLVINRNGNKLFTWSHIGLIDVSGVKYDLYEALYNEKLPSGEMSRPSLLQLMFTHATTQEDVATFGPTLEVLCYTQAVQTEGFQDADTALDAAFGDIAPDNHPWLPVNPPVNP